MPTDNPVLIARKSLGLTQTELALMLGVNLSTIWRWENGKLPISTVVGKAVEQLVKDKEFRDGVSA